jgi:hypothetical protein
MPENEIRDGRYQPPPVRTAYEQNRARSHSVFSWLTLLAESARLDESETF